MTYAQLSRWWPPALAVLVVAFLTYSLPPYFVGSTRVPATFPLYYPLLVGHVLLGGVAMAAVVVQLWPRLRARRPTLHRHAGRIYVATTIPAALSALVIGAATPFGPALAVSNVLLAALWLWFTAAGFCAGRQGRVADHRRHMLRSATLALSIITNRIWGPVLFRVGDPLYHNLFDGNGQHYLWFVAGLGGWLGWTVPLALVQWWLYRRAFTTSSSIRQLTETRPGRLRTRIGQRRRGRYDNGIQRQNRTGHP
ncbi:DUF2306 domain-containing protein [Mycolicibacterium flavescens]|uniref:Membrane protein (DUF2306) n=1 Tax=Mycolicibacterium flavescens TaxID=1776 RepID=A0A1E3RLH8_MYCFV|nr:DUF2306 domain-containing protein [Mycolicibacterium flavescens]MCV7281909.1 DUF2306 domain-containing protein [Mycolicibacterium flavescens]ODQ90719.1 hypothetical protein BHQ18_08235 [Mycolicibacterium flavescens]